jgi:hypothetical protein
MYFIIDQENEIGFIDTDLLSFIGLVPRPFIIFPSLSKLAWDPGDY